MTCKRRQTTKSKTCDRLMNGGLCSLPEIFRCEEYILRMEPRLSHSGIMNFLRCPRMYYYSNMLGLQTRPEYNSDALNIGIEVDKYITDCLINDKPYTDDMATMWEAKVIAIIRAFDKLIDTKKVRKYYTGQREFLIQNDGQPSIKGYIDLDSNSGKNFVELKVGKNPAYYTQLFYIRSKLAAYFMSSDKYETGTVWAIRVPQLKRTGKFKNESLEDYSARCTRVMVAEPTHYFPGYNKKTGNFGVKFGRAEIDLDDAAKVYRMVADWMKLAIKKAFWVQNGTGCLHPFECDYLSICESNGAISEDVFTYRAKEVGKGKLQS